MSTEPPDEPWAGFLLAVDSELNTSTVAHCLGGFAIHARYGLARPTRDIDAAAVAPHEQASVLVRLAGKGSRLEARFGVYFDLVTVVTLPDDYESRLTPIYPGVFKHLYLMVLDPYDLVLSKLERNQRHDREDVRYLGTAARLDLTLLERRYRDELRPYLGVPEREDLTLQLWIEMLQEDRTSPRS